MMKKKVGESRLITFFILYLLLRHAIRHTPCALSLEQETNSMRWSAAEAEP